MVEPAANGSVRGRILVADDEPQVRRLLTTLLEAASFVVDTAEDGPAALGCLEGPSGYDLVLLDLMLPGAVGLGVLDRMRELSTGGGCLWWSSLPKGRTPVGMKR